MKILQQLLLGLCILAPLAQAADNASAPAASAPASASAVESTPATQPLPSKEEVLRAIDTLENRFLNQEALAAAQTVYLFAQQSKEVSVMLSPEIAPWVSAEAKPRSAGDENVRRMLLAAYLAGNIKAQLAAGKPADNPVAGWKLALKAYQSIKQKNKQFTIPEMETLKAKQAKGELPKLAEKALKNKP